MKSALFLVQNSGNINFFNGLYTNTIKCFMHGVIFHFIGQVHSYRTFTNQTL